MPLRVLVIDTDQAIRNGLRTILAGVPAVMLVGEADGLSDGLGKLTALQPDVLILETGNDASVVAEIAKRFRSTAILATGDGISADAIIQVIRAGAIEFLRRPVDRADLVSALEKVARFKSTSAPERRRGRVTAVFSPKGGLGVTTVAVNLAVSMLSSGSTVLVELDTRPSDVATVLDLRPRHSVIDALASVERLDDALLQALLMTHSSGLTVLPGPFRTERTVMSAERVHLVLEFLAGRFEHVVLDLRHEVDPATLSALEVADTILYLTAPNVSALRAGASGLTTFREFGIDVRKVKIILMRDGTGGDVTHKHVRETLGLPVFWRLPSDYRAAIGAVNNGHPLVTMAPRSRLAQSLRELSPALIPEGHDDRQAPEKRRILFGAAWPVKRLL